ncbi:hypothetical protein EDB92DRAFT_13830 [Lactarius akahatsu]|uniref:Uncharacterized protein n=1 Tax=Lactarius akahatsu TaxID=416441 RepID=A0AAD4LU93_9AGAM|nr:hypothetical protein EDB92DRAFT_13830 [Lactarius akahatsu]
MDEYAWPVPPEPPYIFPVPPTPSNNSNGPPQKQPELRMPTATFFAENLPNDTPNPYTPCDAVSPPLATNPASHIFNLSQLYSANASGPSAGKTLPTPPFAFGDIQSSFAFNVDEFWPTLGYEDHSSTSDLSSIPDPIIVPGTNSVSRPKAAFPTLFRRRFSPLRNLRRLQEVLPAARIPKLLLGRGRLGLLADHLPAPPKNARPPKMRAMTNRPCFSAA